MKAPSELHLENWVWENLDRFGTPMEVSHRSANDAFDEFYWVDEDHVIYPYFDYTIGRQVRFAHGIADLVGLDFARMCIQVVELKRDAITMDAVTQVARYMHDIKHFLGYAEWTNPFPGLPENFWTSVMDTRVNPEVVCGMVIGESLPDKNTEAVASLLNIPLVTYDYDPVEGYTFKSHTPRDARDRAAVYAMNADHERAMYGAINDIVRTYLPFFNRQSGGVE